MFCLLSEVAEKEMNQVVGEGIPLQSRVMTSPLHKISHAHPKGHGFSRQFCSLRPGVISHKCEYKEMTLKAQQLLVNNCFLFEKVFFLSVLNLSPFTFIDLVTWRQGEKKLLICLFSTIHYYIFFFHVPCYSYTFQGKQSQTFQFSYKSFSIPLIILVTFV